MGLAIYGWLWVYDYGELMGMIRSWELWVEINNYHHIYKIIIMLMILSVQEGVFKSNKKCSHFRPKRQ